MKTSVLYKTVVVGDYEYYIFYTWQKVDGEWVWLCDDLDRLTFEEACIKYPVDEYRWRLVQLIDYDYQYAQDE